jgi:hypothetical protein
MYVIQKTFLLQGTKFFYEITEIIKYLLKGGQWVLPLARNEAFLVNQSWESLVSFTILSQYYSGHKLRFGVLLAQRQETLEAHLQQSQSPTWSCSAESKPALLFEVSGTVQKHLLKFTEKSIHWFSNTGCCSSVP